MNNIYKIDNCNLQTFITYSNNNNIIIIIHFITIIVLYLRPV